MYVMCTTVQSVQYYVPRYYVLYIHVYMYLRRYIHVLCTHVAHVHMNVVLSVLYMYSTLYCRLEAVKKILSGCKNDYCFSVLQEHAFYEMRR